MEKKKCIFLIIAIIALIFIIALGSNIIKFKGEKTNNKVLYEGNIVKSEQEEQIDKAPNDPIDSPTSGSKTP